MNKEIAFFDLDGTLWNIKNDDIWVIDKDKPYKPLLIIDRMEFSLIESGRYEKDELPLNYNGKVYFISKDLFEKIKKKSGSENIERFGISFIPQVRKEILDKREIDVLSHNISHLRYNKFIDIGVLTARSNQKNHAELINKLRLELKKIGIEISKIFFVGNNIDSDYTKRKMYVLLEHLIGLKIKDGRFVSIKQDWYKKVSFYDDDDNNILAANNIQKYLEYLLRKTDDELFRIVIDRIKSYELKLDTYLVVDNEVNRFKKNSIELQQPLRFPIHESILNYKKWMNVKESSHPDDPWDEEVWDDKITLKPRLGFTLNDFKKEYGLLKALYNLRKYYDEPEKTSDFLNHTAKLLRDGDLQELTLKYFISWENLDTTAVIDFYKNKPNNIVAKTILGEMVVNLPRPRNWEDLIIRKIEQLK